MNNSQNGLLGPLFGWDVIRQARHRRGHEFRVLYALVLLGYLYLQFGSSLAFSARWSAYKAEQVAFGFILLQTLAILLLTPLFVVGIFPEERQRGTLDVLLASGFSARDIVLGKMGARLVQVLGILLTGIPVIALLQFLGGVQFSFIIKGTLLGLGLLVTTGCYSIWASTKCKTVGSGIATTFGWLYGTKICASLAGVLSFFLFRSWHYALEGGWTIIWFGLLADLLMAIGAVVFAIRQVLSGDNPANRYDTTKDKKRATKEKKKGEKREPKLMSIPQVGNHPVYWRECYFPRDDKGLLDVGLSLVPFLWLLLIGGCFGAVDFFRASSERQATMLHNYFWGLLVVNLLALLLAAVMRSAGSFANERSAQTLQQLLVLPLSTVQLVWMKWFGSIMRYQAVIYICLILFLVSFLVIGWHGWLLALVFAGHLLLFSLIGLTFSIYCKTAATARFLMGILLLVFLAWGPLGVSSWQLAKTYPQRPQLGFFLQVQTTLCAPLTSWNDLYDAERLGKNRDRDLPHDVELGGLSIAELFSLMNFHRILSCFAALAIEACIGVFLFRLCCRRLAREGDWQYEPF